MDLNERDSTPRVWQASMQESCRQLVASHMHTRLLPYNRSGNLVLENYDKEEEEEKKEMDQRKKKKLGR